MLYSMNLESGKLEPIDESQGDKNNLPVGTVLHLNGYSDPDYVITANMGVNQFDKSYGATYETVNLEDGNTSKHQAYTLKWMKDKQDNRIQMYITDKVMSAEEMKEALLEAAIIKAENDIKAREKADAKEKEIKELPSKYPYLTPMDEAMKYRGHALGAKNLRIELKRAFPGVKFSVKSETYSGGDSIHVNWTDGPLKEDVKKISDKYQEGNFDGMEDIYNYDHENVFPKIFGGAKYVMEQRHESAELILKVAQLMGFNIPAGESDNYGNLPGLDSDISRMIYREARQTRA
jgi:hypothetical protein